MLKSFALLLTFILGFTFALHAQLMDALPRHAFWGAGLSGPYQGKAGATVTVTLPGSFAETIDLRKGDVLLKVNGILISSSSIFHEVFYTTRYIKGGNQVTIDLLREGRLIQKKGTIPARSQESFKGIVTEYKSIMSPYGYRVQVIITRPEGIKGKIPGVFFVRWMSCDPIEKPVSRKHGVAQLLEDFVQKSGYAVMRVEKPGLGDSEGPACYNADFQEELAAHKEAYKAFSQLEFVDPTKIVVLAQSNGAAYAPLVVDERQPAAFIVSGGWVKTWYEHMLEYKRKDFELNGLSQAEINKKMRLVTELYTEYLINKKIPGEIIGQKPHLKEVWDDEYDHQWGLPVAYQQQLQELNIAEAWSKVKVPTYVFYGEYDAAMTEADHKKIAELVTKNGNLVRYELIPNMGHSLFWFESQQKAHTDFWSGTYKNDLAIRLINWMKEVVK